jgi:CelD/BcsL family acetyltransferase involved in cellulose biosynthesis
MRVIRLTHVDDLKSIAPRWDRLALGIPFRMSSWLIPWWKHYAKDHSLCALCVWDESGGLAGFAPWYIERSTQKGRTLRFLGSNEVCSEYLTVLSRRGWEEPVCRALADWLCGREGGPNGNDHRVWDWLDLSSVDGEDPVVPLLVRWLGEQGCQVHSRTAPPCWRIRISEGWEPYVATLSRSHRKQIRRCERRTLTSGRSRLVLASEPEELEWALDVLIELHQRRRLSLGEPGCFQSATFTAFLREAARSLFESGQVRLAVLNLDGEPAAAELHLTGNRTAYAYQAGIDPGRLTEQPGRLLMAALARRSAVDGYSAIDLLRGDEPYKAHWRAEPRPCVEFHVAARGLISRVRHGVWLTGESVKHWLKSSWRSVGAS